MGFNRNLIPLIKANFNAFTKAEKKVAVLVLNDPRRAVYSSITDLAIEAKVGDTSVLRFYRKLGFNDYQSFKMTLAQSLDFAQNIGAKLSDEIDKEDTLEVVCKKLLNIHIAALNETHALINLKELNKAAELLLDAKRIVFFGSGSSSVTAGKARIRFMRIFAHVEAPNDMHMQSMAASLMNSNELAVAFSYSGSTKDTVDVLRIAKESGAKTIAITRYAQSPITKYSDVILLLGATQVPFQGGALSTKIADLYIIDLLYTEFFRRNKEIAMRNKERTSEAINEKLY